MSRNTKEYRIVKECTPQLRLAVQSDITHLSGQLLGGDLINVENDASFRNKSTEIIDRAADLVSVISDKVEQDPGNYYKFVSILKNCGCQYEAVLKQLEITKPKALPGSDSSKVMDRVECKCDFCRSERNESLSTSESFPFLDDLMENLGELDKECLRVRLKKETQQIKRNFFHLLLGFYESLRSRNVPLKDIKTYLMMLEAFKDTEQHPKPLFLEQKEKIDNATDLNDIIDVIKNFCSFFDYGLVEDLINSKLGTSEDRKQLKRYEESFTTYARRKVKECPSRFKESGSSQPNMILKLDSSFDEYLLSQIYEFRVIVCGILNLSCRVLHLCCVNKGCVCLTFRMPIFVQRTLFPLLDEQEERLKTLGISQLTCGTYKLMVRI